MKQLTKQEIGIVLAFIMSLFFMCLMNLYSIDRVQSTETKELHLPLEEVYVSSFQGIENEK
ncbi:hypothetical protein [Alkalihalobacillus sp. LMS39]|uniref:hypothetical protein n=1 Tax=Alkalihalobacillus sp. LMS39 TaxID=2924032 RepID=UPI001FB35927|nr:hypothetical protein [Alkalihalobacillus sp. LMS39]UOE92754.1 hypothetical protein MM271_16170 [Alkalihalobacillus sp. LMS39]